MNNTPSPRSWGTRLRQIRLARGQTLEELATRADCTKGYLSGIENGRRDLPSDEIIARLEKALDLAPGELARAAGWERTPTEVRREVLRLAAREAAQRDRERKLASILRQTSIDEHGRVGGALDEAYRSGDLHRLAGVEGGSAEAGPVGRFLPREIPLINSVVAGVASEAFSDPGYPARVADEYVRTPDIDDPDAFAARVVGDSMMPEYREGDVVVFSPGREIVSGMDCFARLEPDGETTFKRVFFEEGSMIRLQPLNPRYAARTLEREQVAGLFAAVSVIKKLA
ncbi:MAG: XRE family transcriptional regulator [Phycisphaerales bacterium]|nr:helix-turn-helix domain-containing protein [Planctomycetota bacterium]